MERNHCDVCLMVRLDREADPPLFSPNYGLSKLFKILEFFNRYVFVWKILSIKKNPIINKESTTTVLGGQFLELTDLPTSRLFNTTTI